MKNPFKTPAAAIAAALPFLCAALIMHGCHRMEEPLDLDVRGLMLSPDEHGNVLPDFSHAGYMGGGVALPDVPAVKELSPEPAGCDRERIQEALDEIGKMPPDEDGFRGALLLRAGEYRVGGYLHIDKSGVVLRGEGQSAEGTSIRAIRRDYVPEGRRLQHSLIYLGKHESSRIGFLGRKSETVMEGGVVPVGSREVKVAGTEGFAAGDEIVIRIFPNRNWVETLKMEEYWSSKAEGTWSRFYYERRITDIEGNTLILDAPMTFYLDDENFHRVVVWNYEEDERISNSGVENLRLTSYFSEENYGALENFRETYTHARNAVKIQPVRDCWVRNVTALYFPHAAVLVQAGARNITIQDCAYLRPVSRVAGGRRYPFRVDGTRVLVQRCYAREARHAFVSSSVAPGPNVFLDCFSEKNFGDVGPHIKWATGFLYDNISAPQGPLSVIKQRGGHGWRGVNHVLWNCTAAQIRCDEPETKDTNWSIGSIGAKRSSPRRARFGRWISHGRKAAPRSLYLWQLENRLGENAVKNISIEVQRQPHSRKIHDYLKEEFAELTAWERYHDGNLLLDPGFRITVERAPWRTTEKLEDPFGFDLYAGGIRRPDGLERGVNPVFQDDTAVVVPAGRSLRTMPAFFMYPGDPGRSEIGLNLSFDYKMEKEGSLYAAVIHHTIRTGTDDEGYGLFTYGTTRWDLTGVHKGPARAGSGEWGRYSFDFSLTPEFYGDTNVPYPTVLAIKVSPGSSYTIANPSLRIAGD